jgi:hypothetical protein
MAANAMLVTIVLLLALGFWFMGELTYFIPYKGILLRDYGKFIGGYFAALFLNLFATAFAFNRKFFLKDTGRKLSHLDKQLQVGEMDLPRPALEEEADGDVSRLSAR